MAKKYLKACVKLNALPDDEQFDSVVRKYKAGIIITSEQAYMLIIFVHSVCKIARLLDKLDSCSSHNERISSLEKMADICSHRTVSFYTAAIHFYMQEVRLGKKEERGRVRREGERMKGKSRSNKFWCQCQ